MQAKETAASLATKYKGEAYTIHDGLACGHHGLSSKKKKKKVTT